MGDNLDYQLQKAIQTAAEVEKKLAEGTLKATSDEYIEAQKQLEALEEKTIEDVTTWSKKQQALEEQKDLLKEYQKEYQRAVEDQDTSKIEEFEGKIKDTSKEIDTLIGDLKELDEPTEFVLEVAMSEAKENIAEFKKDIDELVKSGDEKAIKINSFVEKIDTTGLEGLESLGFVKGPDGVWRGTANIEGWSQLDPASKQKVLEYINMLEGEHQIDVLMGEGTVSVEEQLSTIAQILEDIAKILDPTYTLTVDTTDAEEKTTSFKGMWDGLGDKKITLFQNVVETVTRFFTRTPKEGDGTNVNGTANAHGSWGAPKTETSLVGELGPEILVRGNRWTTVGDNGAEFTQVKKGDIIFNHRQTEELLKNGHVTGRGKAYASGTAYAKAVNFDGGIIDTWDKGYQNVYNDYRNAVIAETGANVNTTDTGKNLAGDYDNKGDDAEDKFEEFFDWIEVRIEELNEKLDLKGTQLENAVGAAAQNRIVDEMIGINKELRTNLLAAAKEYESHAAMLRSKIDGAWKDMADNGAIDIELFKDEIGEAQYNAIQE
jgi:tetrahydromethanopterin S-methyltransferase subunit B